MVLSSVSPSCARLYSKRPRPIIHCAGRSLHQLFQHARTAHGAAEVMHDVLQHMVSLGRRERRRGVTDDGHVISQIVRLAQGGFHANVQRET
ncbi:hypothetical protein G6F22_019808 [Rhizopus arrhizus]|nr:hypothetical protein G6F22_019808 [Rhizopus arrhizus]